MSNPLSGLNSTTTLMQAKQLVSKKELEDGNLNCALKVDDYREGREPEGTTREQVVGAMALYR